MYKCILFDMDGTLVNSYAGIYHAYRYAFERLGLPFGGEAFVRHAIGAPLPLVFSRAAGMREEAVPRAVELYREYYARRGKYEAEVYSGMAQTLRQLKEAGGFLGVATLKKEEFAREMLQNCGILGCFDSVCGMDAADSLTKADLLRRGMQQAGAAPADTVLVGDSEFDVAGAADAGVDFLAVTYGFGFREAEVLRRCGIARWADYPQEIPQRLGIPVMVR